MVRAMEWCQFILAILIVTQCLPGGAPAMSKSALLQMQSMMKNVCKNKSGVKQDLLTKVKETGVFEEDAKFKCYLKCCLGMMQTMKNNKINVESATKQVESLLPPEMKEPTLKQLHACKGESGSDPCDLAYRFTVCSYNFDKNNFFIPL